MIQSAKVRYDELMMQNFKSNSKMLYSYVRSKSKVRSKIGQLEKSDGTLTANDKDTVEVLNSFFLNLFLPLKISLLFWIFPLKWMLY